MSGAATNSSVQSHAELQPQDCDERQQLCDGVVVEEVGRCNFGDRGGCNLKELGDEFCGDSADDGYTSEPPPHLEGLTSTNGVRQLLRAKRKLIAKSPKQAARRRDRYRRRE